MCFCLLFLTLYLFSVSGGRGPVAGVPFPPIFVLSNLHLSLIVFVCLLYFSFLSPGEEDQWQTSMKSTGCGSLPPVFVLSHLLSLIVLFSSVLHFISVFSVLWKGGRWQTLSIKSTGCGSLPPQFLLSIIVSIACCSSPYVFPLIHNNIHC